MENGFSDCGDPKALLIPGTFPLPVHAILDRTDDMTKCNDELPSTIDMDALKGPPPTDTQFLNSMAWKRSPRLKTQEMEALIEHPHPTTMRKQNTEMLKHSNVIKAANKDKQVTEVTKKSSHESSDRSGSSSSSDSEDSVSSSSSSSCPSSVESTEESDNGKNMNGNRDEESSSSSSSSSSKSSRSGERSGGPSTMEKGELTIIPNKGLRKSVSGSAIDLQSTKSKLVTPTSPVNRRSASTGRRNGNSKKAFAVNSEPDSLKVKIQALVSKIQQKNADLTITPISAPSVSSLSSSVMSTAKLSTNNDVSVTSILKSSIPVTSKIAPLSASPSSGRKKRNLTVEDLKMNGNTSSLIIIDGSHQQQSSTEARQRLPPKKRLVHQTQFQEKNDVSGGTKNQLHSSVMSKPSNNSFNVINSTLHIPNCKATTDQVKITVSVPTNVRSTDIDHVHSQNGQQQQESPNPFETIGEQKSKGIVGKSFQTFADFVQPSKKKRKIKKMEGIVLKKKQPTSKRKKKLKLKRTRKSSRISGKKVLVKMPKPIPQSAMVNKKAAIIENIFSPKRNPPVSGIRTKAELKEVKPAISAPMSPMESPPIPVPIPKHVLSPSSNSPEKRKLDELHLAIDDEQNSKRIKRDLEKLLETPSKPIEVVDAATFKDAETIVNSEGESIPEDLKELLETPSKPIEVLDASEYLDLSEVSVLDTPPAAQVSPSGGRKRRKMNRTGFPSKKRKKKLQGQDSNLWSKAFPIGNAAQSVALYQTTGSEAKPELNLGRNGLGSETATTIPALSSSPKRGRGRKRKQVFSEDLQPDTPNNADSPTSKAEESVLPPPPLPSSSSSTRQTAVLTSFTPTLTERIKIRKRSSIDDVSSWSSSCSDKLYSFSGISPALLNVVDSPIIIPEKTNHLAAGLLSKYYKGASTNTNSDGSYAEQIAVSIENNKSSQQEAKLNEVLPAPVYAAAFFRERRIDFTLPYDIWCFGVIKAKEQHDHWKQDQENLSKEKRELKALEMRRTSEMGYTKAKKVQMPEIIPESWNFKKIRQNTYLGYNKPPVSSEPEFDQLCDCEESEFKCSGEDCLNRVMFTECPAVCGENCMNRRLQKHDWALDLKRFLTADKGYGVKTGLPIKRGNFILEYVGEVVPDSVFKERMHTIYANDTHHYCLQLENGRVIDGHRSGGLGRFVNHSCEPNCEMQKWSVSGLSRMALFALRDIEPGEELSYDYNFSLYNPAEGQPCHCGSENCRGVIGGRTKQNVKSEAGTSKRKSMNRKGPSTRKDTVAGSHAEPAVLEKMKVLSKRERLFIHTHRCFLLRNYDKIRTFRGEVKDKYGDKLEKLMTGWCLRYKVGSTKNKPLQIPHDEDPEFIRIANISQILYVLYATVTQAKDKSGKYLCEPFMEPPARRRYPQFYAKFENGLKLNGLKSMEKAIQRGEYRSIQQLEADLGLILNRFSIAFEAERPLVQNLIPEIKSIYKEQKQLALLALDPFIIPPTGQEQSKISGPTLNINAEKVDASLLPKFIEPREQDEVIRCICGTYAEDGVMIQCDKCMVWQHYDCVKAPGSDAQPPSPNEKSEKPYYCEICEPREVSLDIMLNPPEKANLPGLTFYLKLTREDGFVVRKHDTVYVLRAWPEDQKFLKDGIEKPRKTYLNAGLLVPSECDIVRVEELRKDNEGKSYIMGYNYLRPYETFHEPSRRFYPNEILRAPIVEVIPLDLIHGRCWVLDSTTYCKGRPKGCIEEHLYICDMRVDKAARSFSKIGKPNSQAYCIKNFAFNHFETKLKIQRNFHPHGPPSPDFKIRSASAIRSDIGKRLSKTDNTKCKGFILLDAKKKSEKRDKVNRTIELLSTKVPGFETDKIDLSHLLSPRKKPVKKLQF